MKLSKLILLLLLAGGFPVRAEILAGWSTNLTGALKEAASGRKPVLVYFTASWCGPCQMMARTTFVDKDVVRALGSVTRVALDIDEHPDLAEQHGVRAVPTFEMLSPGGDEIVRATGYQLPEEFLQWLTNSIGEVKEAAARQSRMEKKLAAADQLLALADAESARKAAAELFEICAEREGAIFKAAAARLETLAARQPAVLLDGLNHPRLATRIQVANVLRARLGDAFDVDPWSDAATREKIIRKWREKFASALPVDRRNP